MRAFAETPYIGGLSGMSFAKLAKAKSVSPSPLRQQSTARWAGRHLLAQSVNLDQTGPIPAAPNGEMADRLFRIAYLHVQARYPFMQQYFAASLHYLDDLLVKHDLLAVQALAMTAMYSFRSDSIADDEIDAEVSEVSVHANGQEPLDIECDEVDPAAIRAAHDQRDTLGTLTSVLTRLAALMPRTRFKNPTPMSDEETNVVLGGLQTWKDRMPVASEPPRQITLPLLEPERMLKGYYVSASSKRSDPFLRQVGEAAAQCCEVLASSTPAHSMAALYSAFVSGLTLLHVLATQRDIMPQRRASRAIRACSKSFRTAFEDLVDGMEEEALDREAEAQRAPDLSVDLPPSIDPRLEEMPFERSSAPLWQRKVQDLEAMLQGNLQQDLVNYSPDIANPTAQGPLAFAYPADSIATNLELASMFDFAAYAGPFES
ncbi:hypothetical protein IAU60_003739 [Kwoniella sp. DSM 27419]